MIEKEILLKAIEEVEKILTKENKLTNFVLLEICREQGIEIIGSKDAGHIAHEILEVAVNNYISKSFERKGQSSREILCKLKALEEGLPPQSWRTNKQKEMQQFSTPPQIAYLLANILNPTVDELILEPSAGTGSLAAWLRAAGCKIHVNELSAIRRTFLALQGYQPTGLNAEFLDDLLPNEIAPEGILMNPPFSASGGRVKTGDSNFGFRHIKSALARLKTGGRLVALLGNDSVTKSDKGRRFLSEIAANYDLRAVITLPKSAYYKYGTNFQTCIVCIKKPEKKIGDTKADKNTLEANCQNLEECLSYADVFNR